MYPGGRLEVTFDALNLSSVFCVEKMQSVFVNGMQLYCRPLTGTTLVFLANYVFSMVSAIS